MTNFRSLIAASAAVLCGFAAFCEPIVYDADATVTEPLALSADTEISVAAGKTVIYTNGAAISGAFKLTKKGAGTLKLAEANTFSGGIVIDEGFLFAQNAGALGNNEVTINGDGVKDCQLVFDCQDATFANNVTVTGSSGTKPALGFYRPGSTQASPGATLSGNVTATGNLGIRDYDGVVGGTSASQSWIMGKITGAINAEGQTVTCGPCGIFYFSGAVTADTFRVHGDFANYRGILHLGSNANKFTLFQHSCCRVVCDAANVLGYATIQVERPGAYNDEYRNAINVSGKNQTVAQLTKTAAANFASYDNAGGGVASTLTISGIPGNNEAVSIHHIYGKVSVQVGDGHEYIDFCQTFTNVDHTTSGGLTAKRGTFNIAGTATFTNATSVNVNYNSKLRIASSKQLSLKSVSDIYLGQGRLEIVDGTPMPFTDWKALLTVNNSAGIIRIPEGETLRVRNAKGNGNSAPYYPAGRWTKSTCKFVKLEGDGVLENRGTALWSGAGTSEATSEIANWKDSSNPDLSIEGNSLTIPADATDPTLSFVGVNYVNQLAATGSVVTLKAADADARLVIGSGNILLGTDTKLVLKFKPEVADNTLIVAGVDTSTVQLDGEVYSKMQVPNGKLIIGADATLPEVIELIQVADKDSLSFEGPARTVVVNTLKYGNSAQYDGDYQFGNVTVKVQGGYAPVTPSSTAIWDAGAGADDAAISKAENWVDDTLPTFNSATRLIFANAGTNAVVSGEVTAHSVMITNNAEVAAEGPSAFTLEGSTSDPKDTVLTVYQQLYAQQKVTQATFKNITIATPFHQDEGTATYNGAKTFSINTTDNSTYPLILRNAVIEKPLAINLVNQAYEINAAEGYNVIRGHFLHQGSKWGSFSIAPGATLVYMNGITAGWKMYWNGAGTLVISNRPWRATNTGNGVCQDNHGKIVFGAQGNYFGQWNSNNGGAGLQAKIADGMDKVYEFTVDDAFNHVSEIRMTFSHSTRSHMHVELHGTKQQLAGFYSTSLTVNEVPTRNWIHGDAGSELWVSNCVQRATTNYLHVTGGAGIRSSGSGLYALALTSAMLGSSSRLDHESTGRLRVDGGTLYLGPNVSWRNGPVEIASTSSTVAGTLKISEDGQLGRRQTLSISGGGIIDIPDGVTVAVGEATLDGEKVEIGEYTAGSEGIRAHITGNGTLKVCKPGTYFIIK